MTPNLTQSRQCSADDTPIDNQHRHSFVTNLTLKDFSIGSLVSSSSQQCSVFLLLFFRKQNRFSSRGMCVTVHSVIHAGLIWLTSQRQTRNLRKLTQMILSLVNYQDENWGVLRNSEGSDHHCLLHYWDSASAGQHVHEMGKGGGQYSDRTIRAVCVLMASQDTQPDPYKVEEGLRLLTLPSYLILTIP